jgi:probable HAF family extracellular repeat protein
VNGTTITPIVLNVNNGILYDVEGINRWGTIVGTYNDTSGFPSVKHGFKRWNNGTTHTLDFPGATPSSTSALGPQGINDNGTVVGQYDNKASLHGFIFHNGQWATLDYPQASATFPAGITNAGKIVGGAIGNTFNHAFLYENGTFKIISLPNGGPKGLLSISPKQGLILGITGGAGMPAFIAKCQ